MPNPAPIQTEHSTSWHWEKFAEFTAFKAEVKEPSPHMQMIGPLTDGSSFKDILWFTGLYANFYNIPSALAMWQDLPVSLAEEFMVPESHAVEQWLSVNWAGLTTRTERRTVRSVPKMAECLRSYWRWMNEKLPIYLGPAYANMDPSENESLYDLIWKEAEHDLRYMGRYIIIRLMEGLHRFVGLQPYLYDIRSIGGWSPKRALGLLYPEHLDLLLSPDTKENVQKVDEIAYATMERFATDYAVPMSPYVFAAMLCEYRVAYENRHQYPGWTLCQEPAHWYKIKPFWLKARGQLWVNELEQKFFGVRTALFPSRCLGELHGWSDKRSEPRSSLRDFGYNWSDLHFNYWATKELGDWNRPVVWHD